MNKRAIAMMSSAAILLGGASMLSAEITQAPPASAFSPIQRYAITYDDPRDVAEFYVRDLGFKPRDAEFVELEHPSDPAMRILVATVEGIRDDSVKGIQWRIATRFSAGNWEATEAGMRRKCQRGNNANQWTRDVCP